MSAAKPLIPLSFAEPLREFMAQDIASGLRFSFGVSADEATQRGRRFVAAWERAGCPTLGDDEE